MDLKQYNHYDYYLLMWLLSLASAATPVKVAVVPFILSPIVPPEETVGRKSQSCVGIGKGHNQNNLQLYELVHKVLTSDDVIAVPFQNEHNIYYR